MTKAWSSWRTGAAMAALGVAAVAGMSGCGIAVASESHVLASRAMTGGLCPDGPCNEELVLHDDGLWRWTDNSTGKSNVGLLSSRELAEVADAVAETRITEGPPFEDICPIAYDGMEVTYGVPEGSVSNCDLLVDASDPLVEILDDLAAQARRG